MKKNKNIKKFFSFFMTFSMICSLFNTVVFAGGAPEEIRTAVLNIVNAVAYLGYAIAFGMFFYLGAKYTMAPANEKADVKQGSINYLIGAFLILCASGVANLFSGIAASGGVDAGGIVGAADGLVK